MFLISKTLSEGKHFRYFESLNKAVCEVHKETMVLRNESNSEGHMCDICNKKFFEHPGS
jgi:hypothetical protein